jgi:hypothetical protein
VVPDVLKQHSAFVFKIKGVQEEEPEELFFYGLPADKVPHSSETSGDTNPETQHHVPELNPQTHCYGNCQISYTV